MAEQAGTGTGAVDAAERLIDLLKVVRARTRQLPTDDLTPSQVAVLLRISRDRTSSTTRLAAAEGVRSQSMTATLNSLVQRGLVERRADPSDGRRHLVSLSSAGADRIDADRAARHEWLADALAESLKDGDLRTLNRLLEGISAALDRATHR